MDDRILFHPEAAREYIETYLWYHKIGPNLANAFEVEIERAIRLIVEDPHQWPIYHERFRRILVRRFPYLLIYSVRGETVTVIAVAHARRKPSYRKNRTR